MDNLHYHVQVDHDNLCEFLGIEPDLDIERIDVMYSPVDSLWHIVVEFPPPVVRTKEDIERISREADELWEKIKPSE